MKTERAVGNAVTPVHVTDVHLCTISDEACLSTFFGYAILSRSGTTYTKVGACPSPNIDD